MSARYESPEVSINLTKEEIHKRYQDTAMVIFKVRKIQVILQEQFGNCEN